MSDIKAIGGQFLNSVKTQIELARHSGSGAKQIESHSNNPEKAAAEFESLLVQQMVKTMWQSVPKSGLLSGGYEEELYQEMFQKEISNHIAEYQSFGIKDMVLREMREKGDIPPESQELTPGVKSSEE